MIFLLILFQLGICHYKLLHSIQKDVISNDQGAFQIEKSMENDILVVFKFENANYPVAVVSYDPLNPDDYNRTVKPTFIESKKNVYFDSESIQAHQSDHFIELPYAESIYYSVKDGYGSFNIKIEVYSVPHSNCVNNCQGFTISENYMIGKCIKKCECPTTTFGSYCQFQRIHLQQGIEIELELNPQEKIYLSYDLQEEGVLLGNNVIDPITVSFGILGIQGFEIPDTTSYTAILYSQVNLGKLMLNLKKQYSNSTTLIIGLQCQNKQKISVVIKPDINTSLFSGNCLFLIFAVLNILVLIFCFAISSLCKDKKKIIYRLRRKKTPPPLQLDPKPKTFSGQFIDKHFEIFDYQDIVQINKEFSNSTQCVVCMEDLIQKEICITPCGHLFHHHCLKKWMMRILTCPSCRYAITYDQVVEGGWFGSKLNRKSSSEYFNSSGLLINESQQICL